MPRTLKILLTIAVIAACVFTATGVLNAPTDQSVPVPTSAEIAAIPISACMHITESGLYALDSDIAGTANGDSTGYNSCITLQSVQDVVLDCRQHRISGAGAGVLDSTPIYIDGAKNIEIQNCRLESDSSAPFSPLKIEGSSNVVFSDNTLNERENNFYMEVQDSSKISFLRNTGYFHYRQVNTTDSLIEDNMLRWSIRPEDPYLSSMIELQFGARNTVSGNTLDGGARGDGNDKRGTDNAITVADEGEDHITGNTVSNVFCTGIETLGNISDSVISGNSIRNAGISGIGAWYWNSWKNNRVRDNRVEDAPVLFAFFRSRGLRAQDTGVYFMDNLFKDNRLARPRDNYYSSYFDFSSSNSILLAGERSYASRDIQAARNTFVGNDFGTGTAPAFLPSSLAIDGGGNTCGDTKPDMGQEGPYPLVCGEESR